MYNLSFLSGWTAPCPKLPEVKYFLCILKMVIFYIVFSKFVLRDCFLFRIKTSYVSTDLHANIFCHTYILLA